MTYKYSAYYRNHCVLISYSLISLFLPIYLLITYLCVNKILRLFVSGGFVELESLSG